MNKRVIRVGDKSEDALTANFTLFGHNIFQHQELFSSQHGIFSEDSALASKRMRWWLGYPKKQCTMQYDKILDAYLHGHRKRTPLMLIRARQRHAVKPKYVFPLAKGHKWKALGWPYQGTHGKEFNKEHGTDNWESENAIDIACSIGTPVVAPADGTIGTQFGPLGSDDPRMAGIRVHLVVDGDEFYLAHLSSTAHNIKPGVKVKQGAVIGASGSANGVSHLHLAMKNGNPAKIFF